MARMKSSLIYLAFALVISFTLVQAKKMKEGGDLPTERHFRSKKASLIWEKAQKRLHGEKSRLDELKSELKELDEELMKLKHAQLDNQDPYGDMENSLNEKVEVLLSKYGMAGNFASEKVKSNRIDDQSHHEKELQSLIRKANALGFSPDELSDLESEIDHHRRKMRELDALVDEMATAQQKLLAQKNELDPERLKHPVTEDQLKELKESITEKRKEVEDSRSRLSLMADVPSEANDSTFTEPKIIKLWADVLQSKFTEEERESLKQELLHLERKMTKREQMKENMKRVKKSQVQVKKDGDPNAGEHLIKKHRDLAEQSAQLEHHVNKYEKDIKRRIAERLHSEL